MEGYGIVTRAITLEHGNEPVHDDNDPNTNMTIDFGLYLPEPEVIPPMKPF